MKCSFFLPPPSSSLIFVTCFFCRIRSLKPDKSGSKTTSLWLSALHSCLPRCSAETLELSASSNSSPVVLGPEEGAWCVLCQGLFAACWHLPFTFSVVPTQHGGGFCPCWDPWQGVQVVPTITSPQGKAASDWRLKVLTSAQGATCHWCQHPCC